MDKKRKMNIKIIGTGSIYTAYNGACTLVDDKMIIDMPNGTLKQLLKKQYDLTKIDTILVTHMHGDHTADIPVFLKYIFNALKLNKKIKIIGPVGIKNKIIELFSAYNFENETEMEKYFNIEYIEILEEKVEIDKYIIESYLVIHGLEKPSLGYVINEKLGLTGDASLCTGIEKIFDNTKLIVSDCSVINGDNCHLGIDNLIYLNNKYHKRIIPTHLRDNTREELLKNKEYNIEVVEDFYETNL